MNGSHTSEKLLEYYDAIISGFQIHDKLSRIVTDIASNNIKAFKNLIIPGFESYFADDNENINGGDASDVNDSGSGESDDELDTNTVTTATILTQTTLDTVKDSFDNVASKSALRLPCFAHTLQLVVHDGLQESTCVKHTVTKISKIAKLAHSSTIFTEKLEAIGKSIPRANKTRWNSQLHTVQKVLEIPSTQLNGILTELKRKELCLGTRDLAILNEFVSLLALLGEATTVTQAQNLPSISLVAPSIVSIYFDLIIEQDNVIYTTPLCNALLSSLIGRFGGLLEELDIDFDTTVKKKERMIYTVIQYFFVSSFLDGKFKLKWITESPLSDEKKRMHLLKFKTLYLIIVLFCSMFFLM